MRRALLLAAALAIPVSGAATVTFSNQAGAGGKITCTSLSGNAASTVTISGCTGGHTGGSSQPMSSAVLANGGTIDWVSGSTTTVGKPTLTSTSDKKCPVDSGTTVSGADKANAAVTGDTGDGIKVPGTAKGSVCLYANGDVRLLKLFKIS